MSLVSLNSELNSASVSTVLCEMSYHNAPYYNGTVLYQTLKITSLYEMQQPTVLSWHVQNFYLIEIKQNELSQYSKFS